ncbi:hypothetical protein D3C73_1218640 [compost metagenome]
MNMSMPQVSLSPQVRISATTANNTVKACARNSRHASPRVIERIGRAISGLRQEVTDATDHVDLHACPGLLQCLAQL